MEPRISHGSMYVCTGSGDLFGPVGRGDNAATWEQRCRLSDDPYTGEPWHEPRTSLPEPPGDFPTTVELCYGCASALIPSGSRFSSFFCRECHTAVRKLAESAGFAVIPLGRHTLMNGIALQGTTAREPKRVAAFTAAAENLFSRIDRLADWRRGVVADHVEEMSPGAFRVSATAYLAFAKQHALPKPVLFQQLLRYFGLEPDYPGVPPEQDAVE